MRKIVLGCLVAAFVQPVMAADLAQVYALAKQNDPEFEGFRYQHIAAGEALPQARAGLLPVVSFDAERIETTQDIISSDNALYFEGETDFPTTNYSLTLTQPLFNYANYTQYQQSKSRIGQADAEFETARQDLIIRVAERYFAVLAAEDGVHFIAAEKTAVNEQLKTAQARLANKGRRTDVYDAEARQALVEADEIEARNLLDDAHQALSEVSGELITEVVPLSSSFALQPLESNDPQVWIDRALKSNPALAYQQETLGLSRQEVTRQKAGHYPTLDLIYRFNNRNVDGSLLGGGSETETQDIMVRFSLPLYQGGFVSSRSREAAHLHQKSIQDLQRSQRAVQRSARAAFFGVKNAIGKVEAYKRAVSSQELARQAKKQGHKSGLYTLLAVLDAERDLYGAKRDYARARYDYILNHLKLEQVAGTLDDGDIAEVTAWLNKGQ